MDFLPLPGSRENQALNVVCRGHPGRDHLQRRVQRVVVRVDGRRSQPVNDPELERQIWRAQLSGCEPDMMVGIHQPRHDDVVRSAEGLFGAMCRGHLGIGTDVADDIVPDQDRAILDDAGPAVVVNSRHDVSSADQHRW